MNILRMVKNHIKIHGWPSEPVHVGPATCGQARRDYKSDCRVVHAYAEALESTSMFEESTYAFIYHRPCSLHDDSRSVGRPEYGE